MNRGTHQHFLHGLYLERRLKKAKVLFKLIQARELNRNIYSIKYTLPKAKRELTTVLKMPSDQQSLAEIANS